jgi:peptide/nickel transport system permease protein
MIVKLLKQPQFIIGFLFIAGLLVFSYYWPTILDVNKAESLKLIDYKYDKDGRITAASPFTPSEMPPFGTDFVGKQLFYQVIDGAKYTILIALAIAFFRIVLSVGITLINPKSKFTFLNDIIQATLYVPAAIIAFMLMTALLAKYAIDPSGGTTKLIIQQCLILIAIGVPPLISTFSKEIQSILNKDYIVNTFSLGSKKTYVYYKHVLPELMTKLVLVFAQQAIQSLILLAHLGVLAIFIGGSKTLVLGDMFNPIDYKIPLAGEWAGIIGMSFNKLRAAPWVILTPLAFFAVTIFAINLMIQGIQNCFQTKKS